MFNRDGAVVCGLNMDIFSSVYPNRIYVEIYCGTNANIGRNVVLCLLGYYYY